jgi:CRISPR system Cascade subunit CasD
MAFGGVAVDERLPTSRFPGLSMVCGMIGNALGFRRGDGQALQELQADMEIASRLDRPGHLLRDYQTARLDAGDRMWTTRGVRAGRDGGAKGAFTCQLEKEFLSDASVTLAVSVPDDRIEAIGSALLEPARPLFLGRASCLPSCQILIGIEEHPDLLMAVRTVPFDGPETMLRAQWPARLGGAEQSRLAWVPDIRDWTNRVHSGVREVREGMIALAKPEVVPC